MSRKQLTKKVLDAAERLVAGKEPQEQQRLEIDLLDAWKRDINSAPTPVKPTEEECARTVQRQRPVTEILGFAPMRQVKGRHRKPELDDLAYLEQSDDAWLASVEVLCHGREHDRNRWYPCRSMGTWTIRSAHDVGPFCSEHAAHRLRIIECAWRAGGAI